MESGLKQRVHAALLVVAQAAAGYSVLGADNNGIRTLRKDWVIVVYARYRIVRFRLCGAAGHDLPSFGEAL